MCAGALRVPLSVVEKEGKLLRGGGEFPQKKDSPELLLVEPPVGHACRSTQALRQDWPKGELAQHPSDAGVSAVSAGGLSPFGFLQAGIPRFSRLGLGLPCP